MLCQEDECHVRHPEPPEQKNSNKTIQTGSETWRLEYLVEIGMDWIKNAEYIVVRNFGATSPETFLRAPSPTGTPRLISGHRPHVLPLRYPSQAKIDSVLTDVAYLF